MATTSNPAVDDEWELVNDDGFVYKRKKRPRLEPTSTSTSTSSAPPQPPDPAAEEKMGRERKKRALIKLKDKYQQEIVLWELLSNTLKAMQQQNTLATHTQQQLHTTSFDQPLLSGSPLPSAAQSLERSTTYRRLVDDLISQAEAQEAIISKVSHLCDVAEALCDAQEERLNKSYIDLPIWTSSPRELVASLCED